MDRNTHRLDVPKEEEGGAASAKSPAWSTHGNRVVG